MAKAGEGDGVKNPEKECDLLERRRIVFDRYWNYQQTEHGGLGGEAPMVLQIMVAKQQ